MNFSFISYLRSYTWQVLVGILCCVVVVAGLVLQGASFQGAVFICLVVVLCGFVILISDYSRKRAFFRDLENMITTFEDATLAPSLIEEPSFIEGKVSYDALSHIASSANDQISSIQHGTQEYRTYVEMWVHETKTPIAAAKLMLEHMHGESADKLHRELERIESQVEQALYYARSTSVANDYSIKEVNLAEICRSTCKRQARFLIEKQCIPNVLVEQNVVVLSDKQWLTFILTQVVANAAQYGASKITFSSHVEDANSARERTVLEVADNGIGIPESDISRVFDRAFVGENGRSRSHATGIGLYLVAKMCDQLGIGLAIASEQGKGTRVIFGFPHDRRRAIAQAILTNS